MFEAIPKEIAPMPAVLRKMNLRKISDDEYDYIVSLDDPWAKTRKKDSCMLCSNNGHSNMVMTLCCLSLMCIQCCHKQFDDSTFECPYCQSNLAAFDAKQVFISPAAKERPKTAEAAKRYISTWRLLVLGAKQSLGKEK